MCRVGASIAPPMGWEVTRRNETRMCLEGDGRRLALVEAQMLGRGRCCSSRTTPRDRIARLKSAS